MLIVHFDELLQLIFPLNGLSKVHISYQNTSTPFDLFSFTLGKTVEGVEFDLRNECTGPVVVVVATVVMWELTRDVGIYLVN